MTTAIGSSTYRVNTDSQLQLGPLNLIRNGRYDYSSGGIFYRSGNGYYWQSRVYSATSARLLAFFSTYLNPQVDHYKGYGISLRCLVR